MPRDIERRVIPTAVEIRKKGPAAADTAVLVGYAALFDVVSEDLGGFREVLRPGCFDRALAEDQDVLARAEHDSRMLLGRRSSGTLRLSVDSKGLRYEVDCPDTSAGRDTVALVQRGDVRQSSFAFVIPDPKTCVEWSRSEDGVPTRAVLDCDLIDVAPVASPAYSETSVSARALDDARALSTEAGPARKQEAWLRFLEVRKLEKREASIEDKLRAIWEALYALLGSPWSGDAGSSWRIIATYPDAVIVETMPGTLFSYPVAFDAANAVTLGAPVAVEAQYVPIPPPPADPATGRSIAVLRARNDLAGRG